MKAYYDTVLNQDGRPLAGASVAVKLAGTGTLATLYSDDGTTGTSNPVTTDSCGRFNFYVADGVYDLTFSGTNLTTWTKYNEQIYSLKEWVGP